MTDHAAIDRLVAERVMGFNDLYTLDNAWEKRFSPSTDAAHCRMVEERIGELHWDYSCEREELGLWQVYLLLYSPHCEAIDHSYPCKDAEGIHKIKETAVCIAALRAVGVPEAEIRAALGEEG